MALTICPDCSGKVSDTAPTCPHCGRPFAVVTTAASIQATKTLSPQVGKTSFGQKIRIALFIVFGTTIIIVANHKSEPDIPLIKAALNHFGSLILVKNLEPVALQKCMVSFEAKTGAYYLMNIDIAVGETKELDAEAFTDLDKGHFVPDRYDLRSISIECETANGKRAGTRSYR